MRGKALRIDRMQRSTRTEHMPTKLRTRLRYLARNLIGYDVHKYSAEKELDPFNDAVAVLGAASPITAFDVGANKGQTITAVLNAFPKATIHAFEPSPETFDRHLALLASWNIKVNKCGLGSTTGVLTFHENDSSDMSSFLPLGPSGWGNVSRKITVPVTTVDEYAAKNEIDHIDLLKIDTQGFDLEVIKGAGAMLGRGRIDLLLTEVTLDALYVGLPRFDQIYGFMADRGYAVTGFYDQRRRGRILGWFDAMFASPKAQQRAKSA
jgi:FkbM family methyltransferase